MFLTEIMKHAARLHHVLHNLHIAVVSFVQAPPATLQPLEGMLGDAARLTNLSIKQLSLCSQPAAGGGGARFEKPALGRITGITENKAAAAAAAAVGPTDVEHPAGEILTCPNLSLSAGVVRPRWAVHAQIPEQTFVIHNCL